MEIDMETVGEWCCGKEIGGGKDLMTGLRRGIIIRR